MNLRIPAATFLACIFANGAFSQSPLFGGNVVDANHASIENVEVRAINSNNRTIETRSNNAGWFGLDVPPDNYDLFFYPPTGFARRVILNARLEADKTKGIGRIFELQVDEEGAMVSEFICPTSGNDGCTYVSRQVRSVVLTLDLLTLGRDGKAISCVQIVATNRNGETIRGTSDKAGKAVLKLTPEYYTFEFSKRDFVPLIRRNVLIRVGLENWDVILSKSSA